MTDKMHRFPLLVLACLLASACAITAPTPATPAAPPAAAKSPARPFPGGTFYDLLIAEMALRQHDMATALEHYSNAARDTGDTGVIETAARLARYQNKYQQASEFAEQWLQKDPENAEAHFIMAMALAHTQRPIDALPHMTEVMKRGGESNFAAIAAVALSMDDDTRARFESRLEVLGKSHPDDASLKIARSLMLQYRQKPEAALTLIREVLAREPENAHALLIETRTLLQLDRKAEAITRLKYAVDANPGNKRLRHDLARALIKDDIYQAKAHYEVLVRQFPEDGELLLELMLVNKELDMGDIADAQLRELSKQPLQQSRAHYILGRLAEEDKNWSDALEHYEKAVGDAEFAQASRRLASISVAIEGNDAALARLAQLRSGLPQHAGDIFLLEAEILRKADRNQTGFALLTDALKTHNDNVQIRYARSLFSERLGDVAAVEADLQHIIALEPDNAAALNALGYTLANLTDRYDEAEQLIRRALALEPGDPAITDSLGWVLFRKGHISEAAALLEKAFTDSADHEIAAHLGEALWSLGEKARARQIWQKGLEDTPDSPIILDTLQRLNVRDD